MTRNQYVDEIVRATRPFYQVRDFAGIDHMEHQLRNDGRRIVAALEAVGLLKFDAVMTPEAELEAKLLTFWPPSGWPPHGGALSVVGAAQVMTFIRSNGFQITRTPHQGPAP